MEIWKDVEGREEKFQVSSLGRFKSKKRLVRNHPPGTFRTLKETISIGHKTAQGYLTVWVSHDPPTLELVHRIVAKAFVPNPLNKPHVNHKDSNRENNRAENLEWVTPKENVHHSWREGFAKPPKLNEAKVIQILNHKENDTRTAKLFGVSQVMVSLIRNRKVWVLGNIFKPNDGESWELRGRDA